MTTLQEPGNYYLSRIKELESALVPLSRKRTLYGWTRLISILLAIGLIWYTIVSGLTVLLLVSVTFFCLFFILLSADIKNEEKIKNTRTLIAINKTEREVLDHHFHYLPEGNQFASAHHDYTNDLDIFGKASLFQYLGRTTSEQGAQLLAGWLLSPATGSEIKNRQEAVKELKQNTLWRQQLQATGMIHKISAQTQEKIHNWIQQPGSFINKAHWRILRFLFPSLSLLNILLFIAGAYPSPIFYFLLFIFFVLSLFTSKQVQHSWMQLNKMADEMDTLSVSIAMAENQKFNASGLQQLQQNLIKNKEPVSVSIKKFKQIIDRLDLRLNPLVFIPLNILLFWDLQQVFALEAWKKEHRQDTDNWFSVLAHFEALSSFATLAFNHPGWCFPVITADEAVFTAKELGHPLIPASKRVNNSFHTSGVASIGLITGSNMAGKSTFLRSVGVNIILAMAGAPVCASELTVSRMKVISSMRVSDNLEENTSTFYAELKKLKYIIEAVNGNERVFLLLDEILRGTNSADRHAGSEALIKQLVHHKSAGLIATHDLELAKLTDQFPENIHNYHFDVQVSGEELYFDYKLKEGICRSMNASLLMKKIGIEL